MSDELRVTLADLENTVIDETYHHFPGTTTIVCLLALRNGSHVIGESTCVSFEFFTEDQGRKISRGNAMMKVWTLESYLARESIHQQDLPAEEVGCSGGCGNFGEPNYEGGEFYCGSGPSCCP